MLRKSRVLPARTATCLIFQIFQERLKADEADAKAIEYANKSSELRANALTLKKEEKIEAINEADKYANLSMIREEEANNW